MWLIFNLAAIMFVNSRNKHGNFAVSFLDIFEDRRQYDMILYVGTSRDVLIKKEMAIIVHLVKVYPLLLYQTHLPSYFQVTNSLKVMKKKPTRQYLLCIGLFASCVASNECGLGI